MMLRSVTPEEMIPFFGMITGIIFMVCASFAVVGVARSQIGAAIARRLQGKHANTTDVHEELEAMRDRVATLEQRLSDSEERLDFTERLLSNPREQPQVSDASRVEH
jgi:hypothetical protein